MRAKKKKHWLRISSTDDEHWGWFTWVVLIALFVVYGSISEFFFGVWSKALMAIGFGKMGTIAHHSYGSRGAGPIIWISLCLLIPMFMAGLPAIATLLGLSSLLNPRRKEKEFDD